MFSIASFRLKGILIAVTLKQIAERLNTSQATVSLVLNGKQFHRVSPQTRERIENMAREMGYRPNRQAQILAHGRTHAVALILNKLANPFFGHYVSLIEERLAERGYHVLPMETRSIAEREHELISMFDQQVFDAVLSLGYSDNNDKLYDPSIPLVARLHDLNGHRRANCPWPHVSVEYGPAIGKLVEHLAITGRKNVGLIQHGLSGNRPSTVSQFIIDAIAKQAGLTHQPEWSQPASENDSPQLWYEGAVKLLTQNPEIDTLIVHSAEFAPPVMAAAEAMGRTIGGPGDADRPGLAITTFDDPSYATWMRPGLTVIREPVAVVAEALADRVLHRLEGRTLNDPCIINAELITRGSTGPSVTAD